MSVLSRPTLVLNKGFQAHNAITVEAALTKVIGKRAHIVCPATYPDPSYHYQTTLIQKWWVVSRHLKIASWRAFGAMLKREEDHLKKQECDCVV